MRFMSDHYYSVREAAAYFNIPAFTSVLEWQSLFEQGGLTALEPRKKGISQKMKRPKKPDNRTEQEKLIDKLQAELAYLRAEYDVLKKFQELDAKEEALRRKQSSQKNLK
ncbi:helix-turn-helix domain-containing protein [Wohlfahrtiimonas populi]|uniref:helix-turn-helix domain-containing protein n=1 Tax=Wohlfahrtiimonas populi TaxID=1940240 RepID=UPI002FCDEC8B